MCDNEITHLRKMIAEEYEALKSSITECLPGTIKHRMLDTRMERLDTYYTRLALHLGEQEANHIICDLYIQIIG